MTVTSEYVNCFFKTYMRFKKFMIFKGGGG